jgi:hypothetical protein
MHIKDIKFEDRVTALLRMDDGRQIRVTLKGTNSQVDALDVSVAEIYIEVDDPEVALMDPATLRERLSVVGAVCWNRHWEDAELQATANDQAWAMAAEHLAVAPDDLPLPPDMPSELKVETVLHYAVKLILQEAGEIQTPSESIYVEAESRREMHRRSWTLPAQHLRLNNIELEKRLGLIRPDLVCNAVDTSGAQDYTPLCIEVTVTNQIDPERLSRIRGVGFAALEINLSRFGGRVTRTELKNLVVRQLAGKSWIFNPLMSEKWRELNQEVEALRKQDDDAIELEEEEQAEVRRTPIKILATEYLNATRVYLELLTQAYKGVHSLPDSQRMASAREAVAEAARRLAIKGYPGADDEYLLDQRGLLGALLSLQNDRSFGLDLNSGFQVLNALMSGRGTLHGLAPLYLAAARAFGLPMTAKQEGTFTGWAAEVKMRIQTVTCAYSRRESFDNLLAVLFPELEQALRKTTAKHLASQYKKLSISGSPPVGSVMIEKTTVATPKWISDPASQHMVLQGREREEWIRTHPEAAAALGLSLAPKG